MAARVASATYWIVNTATGAVSSGPSYASQTPIANVVGYTFHLRPNPRPGGTYLPYPQAQLEVIVYDTVSNQAIANQAPQVIPNGYTDFKGYQPHKYLRSRSGDVICLTVDGGPGANQGDFFATDASIPFGQSGDAVLVGTNT